MLDMHQNFDNDNYGHKYHYLASPHNSYITFYLTNIYALIRQGSVDCSLLCVQRYAPIKVSL